MNKRNFIKNLITTGVGFSILPAAWTYDRIWKPLKKIYRYELLTGFGLVTFKAHGPNPTLTRGEIIHMEDEKIKFTTMIWGVKETVLL